MSNTRNNYQNRNTVIFNINLLKQEIKGFIQLKVFKIFCHFSGIIVGKFYTINRIVYYKFLYKKRLMFGPHIDIN